MVKEAKSWTAWPRFDASYLAALGLAAIVFSLAFLTIPGLFEAFRSWPFVASVGLAYSGQDLGRSVLKTAAALRRK
jgi:hypothetical protein